MRYQLFSVGYARDHWMNPGKAVKVAMRVSDLDGVLSSIAAKEYKDWFVRDTKMDKYVDPDTVKKLTGITWVEGDGYPECPCCASNGISHADHTGLPNCLAK